MNSTTTQLLQSAIERFELKLTTLGDFETGHAISDSQLKTALSAFMDRLESNYPFAHPAYAGQMLKPPHPVAWLGYTLAMMVNANNHALDGGPDTSRMEKEVIADFIRFFEFPENSLGHLTASGTIANLEALWIAHCLHPNKAVAFSKSAHYTHSRMCDVLGLKSIVIDDDVNGHPDIQHIRDRASEIGTLVVTMGTTGLGKVEPLHLLLPECTLLGIRVHVDAAYGGFFKTLVGTGLIDDTPWALIGQADSLVVDPHKHGLQPYGCGCVLFRDPAVGHFYKHDSPYTYFTSEELHLGEISLECSRAGAAAAALWLTLQLFPLHSDDGMASILSDCRMAALKMAENMENDQNWQLFDKPELDIVCYYPIRGIETFDNLRERCNQIMQQGMNATPSDALFVSLFTIEAKKIANMHPDWSLDVDRTLILRSVLMKPEHLSYIPELMRRLNVALLESE